MKINIFIKNTVVLITTSFLLRSISLVFKIFLANSLGSEGMGLYQLIFSVYVLAIVFASSGISVAVTKLVCEAEKNREKIVKTMKTAVGLSIFMSVAVLLAIFFCAEKIGIYFVKDVRSIKSIKILSFSLPFISVSSCFKGYFLAKRKTIEPSIAQLFEQVVRISVIFGLIFLCKNKSIENLVPQVILGDTIAEICSFLLCYILYKRDVKPKKIKHHEKSVLGKLIKVALPISATGYLSSILHTAENLLIPTKLALFFKNKERGLQLFGVVKGLAIPVLFFPSAFLTSFSTLLMPEISSALHEKNTKKIKATVNKTLNFSIKISIFIGVAFWFLAYDLSQLLYKNNDVGFVIKILAPIVPFMYLESISVGILNGLDRQLNMFWYNLCDSCIRIAVIFLLLHYFGIKGYLMLMIISNTFTSTLSINCLIKASGIKFRLCEWIIKPVFVCFSGGVLAHCCCYKIENLIIKLCCFLIIEISVFLVSEIFSNIYSKKYQILQ